MGIFRIDFLIIIKLMDNKELLARITVLEREVEQLNSRLAKLEKNEEKIFPRKINDDDNDNENF